MTDAKTAMALDRALTKEIARRCMLKLEERLKMREPRHQPLYSRSRDYDAAYENFFAAMTVYRRVKARGGLTPRHTKGLLEAVRECELAEFGRSAIPCKILTYTPRSA